MTLIEPKRYEIVRHPIQNLDDLIAFALRAKIEAQEIGAAAVHVSMVPHVFKLVRFEDQLYIET